MAPLMIVLLLLFAVLASGVIALVIFFLKRARHSFSIADLPQRGALLATSAKHGAQLKDVSGHDTLFILPDISKYTSFMTGNRFAFGHAQHVIFSLLNAILKAAAPRLELSKLEGDAALFFCDVGALDAAAAGDVVMDIFRAFYGEQARLLEANVCPCDACRHIADLDLKIFVHRGVAARFKFKGAVDHFGTDVIVLHRIMKNGIAGHRYVLITEQAASAISLPAKFACDEVEESVEHIGRIRAQCCELDDDTVSAMREQGRTRHLAWYMDLMAKAAANLRTLRRALIAGRT